MKSRHGERLHALRITSRFCWQGVCLRSLRAVCPSAHAHNHASWQTKGACQPKHPGWGGRWTWCPTWPPPWERWAVQAPCSCDANAESCEAAWRVQGSCPTWSHTLQGGFGAAPPRSGPSAELRPVRVLVGASDQHHAAPRPGCPGTLCRRPELHAGLAEAACSAVDTDTADLTVDLEICRQLVQLTCFLSALLVSCGS